MSASTIQLTCLVFGVVLGVFGKNGSPWLAASLVIAALKGGAA